MDRPWALASRAHVNAPVADLPVRRIVGTHHFLADLTLPYGRVLYDYLDDQSC
jgi:acetoacetate decarboxylase